MVLDPDEHVEMEMPLADADVHGMKATSKEETDKEHARVKALSHEDFLDEVNSLLSIRKVTVSCVHEAGHDLGDAEVFLIAGEEQDENMYVCDCSSCVEAGMLYST